MKEQLSYHWVWETWTLPTVVVSLCCWCLIWLWLKGSTVFIQENNSAYCRLGSELLNQVVHSEHHMWEELDWLWTALQSQNKQQDWMRNTDSSANWSLIGYCHTTYDVHDCGLWCVHIVNSYEQLKLIPCSVVVKTTFVLFSWEKWELFWLFHECVFS